MSWWKVTWIGYCEMVRIGTEMVGIEMEMVGLEIEMVRLEIEMVPKGTYFGREMVERDGRW